jgi:hypothetical protein
MPSLFADLLRTLTVEEESHPEGNYLFELSYDGVICYHLSRNYPFCHGVSAVALTGSSSSGAGSVTTTGGSSGTRWLLLGQEGGAVSRNQFNRLMQQSNTLTADSFKSSPPVEDVFPSLKRGDEGFSFDPHIGYVQSIAGSPYHR